MGQTDFTTENTTKRRFRLKRRTIFLSIAGVVTIVVIAVLLLNVLVNIRAAKVASAVKTSFPGFCTNGQILVEFEPTSLLGFGNYWGVRCDSWLHSGDAFYGEATIVDIDHCTTQRPLISTSGPHYAEMEALNSSNGQKMAVCP